MVREAHVTERAPRPTSQTVANRVRYRSELRLQGKTKFGIPREQAVAAVFSGGLRHNHRTSHNSGGGIINRLAWVAFVWFVPSLAWCLEDAEIPVEAPQDAVMASPAEVQQLHDWVSVALLGREPAERDREVRVVCRRQDHNVLRFGQSCMETPLKIGPQ